MTSNSERLALLVENSRIEARIKEATPLQHFRLFYAFMRNMPELFYPYGEPMLKLAQHLGIKIAGLEIDSLKDNPICCAGCGMQVGIMYSGRACYVYDSKHEGHVKAANVRDRPLTWQYSMTYIAQQLGCDEAAFEHFLIHEELKYHANLKHEASRSFAGFERISSFTAQDNT